VETKELPTAEYQQYEGVVIAVHKKARGALAEIETDFQAGKIDKLQRARACGEILKQEEAEVRSLQVEYSI